jgi:hypothetical protein
MSAATNSRGGRRIAGALLLGIPLIDLAAAGGAFGFVHAVLGTVGVAFLVLSTLPDG